MKYSNEIERLRQLYTEQYPVSGKDTSYSWHPRNPISIYYRHVQERTLVSMLNELDLEIREINILDVGSGSGSLLRFFTSLGSDPRLLHGVDLIPERGSAAQKFGPKYINYSVCDAQFLPYTSSSFDLTCLFTVFSSIWDEGLKMSIAQEITRVLKDNGYLIWYDMCYSKSANTKSISFSETKSLFPNLEVVYRKKLHASLTSRLAKYSFLICDVLDALPFIRKTHNLCLLKKIVG